MGIFALEWLGCGFIGVLILWVDNWTNIWNNFKDEPWKMAGLNLILFFGGSFTVAASILQCLMKRGWFPGFTDTQISEDNANDQQKNPDN